MKVVCAWCDKEGRPAVIGEKELHCGGVTHGICDEHAILLLAEIRRAKKIGSSPCLHGERLQPPTPELLALSRGLGREGAL